jgi:tRNA(fMet)-specific endonuclease VapC
VTLVDTSVLVDLERGSPQALEAVASLLEEGQLAISTVTVHELLRSPSLPAGWRDFWLDFFDAVTVLDLDRGSAEVAARLWQGLSRQARRPDPCDVLIAGTALAAGAELVTADEAFADQLGARLVRPS